MQKESFSIAIITNNFPPTFSGIGDYTFNLASAMQRLGHDINIITTKKNTVLKNSLFNISYCIEEWNALGIQSIITHIKKTNPSIVILQYSGYEFHKYGFPFKIASLLRSLSKSNKVITFFHEIHGKNKPMAIKRFINTSLQKSVIKRVHKYSSASITSCPFYQKQIEKIFPKKTYLARVGSNIPSAILHNKNKIASLKSKLGIHSNFVIGTFGHTPRGMNLIFSCLPDIIKKYPNVKFLILGHLYPLALKKIKALREQYMIDEKHIFISHELSSEELIIYFKLIDIYLMLEPIKTNNVFTGTSTRSGTLATAMMEGLPIIGTKGEKTDDFLKHEENIYLIEQWNKETLTSAVSKLFTDTSLRTLLSKNTKKSFETELTWDTIAQKYFASIQALPTT